MVYGHVRTKIRKNKMQYKIYSWFWVVAVLALSLCLPASHAEQEYSQLPDPFAKVQNPCEDIRNGQFVCKDCATLGFCVQQSSQWNFLEMGTCQTERGFYCDEEALGCVLLKECKLKSRGPKFECQNIGIYPDPYDCKYYHKCSGNMEHERLICPTGTAYSPATHGCSLSADHDICIEQQYNCTKFGEMGAWPTDANIYYFCTMKLSDDGEMIRYPLLYRCQDGYVFNERYAKCIASTTGSATVDANGPTTYPPVTSAPATSAPSTVCLPNSNLLPNPNDCYGYYSCVQGQLVSKKCPSGTYFQADRYACEFGACSL